MTRALAEIDPTDPVSLLYGALVVVAGIVVLLWRGREADRKKRDDERDAEIAEAQEREKEYVLYRETSMATLGDHLRTTQAIALEVKRIAESLERLQRQHESHEKLCDERRSRSAP